MAKKDNREIVVISLGGSILVPGNPDVAYLKKIRKLLIKHMDEMRYIVVVGGGKIARKYMQAGDKVVELNEEEKDWIGIYATRLNAALLRVVLKDRCHNKIVIDPTRKAAFKEDILIGAGYLPGFSSDYDAVLLARQYDVKTIVNLTNIDYVYDKDPRKYKSARPFKDIRWKDYLKIVGRRFKAGMNAPFDPEAAKLAMKYRMKVLIVNGYELDNFDKLLYGEIFRGTIIQ